MPAPLRSPKSAWPSSKGPAIGTSAGALWSGEPPHATNQVASKHIMNCFQQIPESCGALHSPCGGAPQQRGPLTPQHALIGFTPTSTHPSALHIRARLTSSLDTDRTCNARAPTSPRRTGFCAIWDIWLAPGELHWEALFTEVAQGARGASLVTDNRRAQKSPDYRSGLHSLTCSPSL